MESHKKVFKWNVTGSNERRSEGCVLVLQLYLTLCDPMDCSPPASSVHGDSPGKNSGVGLGCHSLFFCHSLLPSPGIKPGSPAVQACSLPSEPPEQAEIRGLYPALNSKKSPLGTQMGDHSKLSQRVVWTSGPWETEFLRDRGDCRLTKQEVIGKHLPRRVSYGHD